MKNKLNNKTYVSSYGGILLHGGILLPLICKLNYVKMQHNHVHMWLIYVNMEHNYVEMQQNYVNMLCE